MPVVPPNVRAVARSRYRQAFADGVSPKSRVLVAALCLLTAITACGRSEDGAGQGREYSDGPGQVAVSFMSAVYAGDVRGAAKYLQKSDQPLFLDISKGMQPNSTRAENLMAGNSKVTGNRATVVLTGTLCALAPSTANPMSPTQRCVSNQDPASKDPMFSVSLAQVQGSWCVTYNSPPQSTVRSSGSGLVSPSG